MLTSLGDYRNVIRFQKFCGLDWEIPHENSSEDEGYGEEDPSKYKKLKLLKYNPFLHHLFEFGSELGNELFYITFLPFVYWNVDEYIARRLIVLWVFNMYVGQGLKDVLKWPRPPCPPVYREEEKQYDNEYGMPSTHAVAGSIVPFTLVYFSIHRYQYEPSLGVLFFIMWTSLVCLSRIYRGMHTFQDVLAGLSAAAFVTALWLPYLDGSLEMFLSSSNAWLFILTIPLAMVFAFPTTCMETRNDTTRIIATGCGCMFAAWADYYLEGLPIPDPQAAKPIISTSLVAWSLFSASRFLIGVAVLLLVKTLVKKTILTAFDWLIKDSPSKDQTPMSPTKRKHMYDSNIFVATPYIFATYGGVGFTCVYLVPRIFQFVGLIL